jgi:predicted TIM-barrel fold metal-dependent hydrolase
MTEQTIFLIKPHRRGRQWLEALVGYLPPRLRTATGRGVMKSVRQFAAAALLLASGVLAIAEGNSAELSPAADHHVHIWSERGAALLEANGGTPDKQKPTEILANDVIRDLDHAKVPRAVILSVAYWFASPRMKFDGDGAAAVRAENDWVAEQVARFPDRLIGFCSFNPISDDALAQLAHCAETPQMRGIKLHLGNSGVDVKNRDHAERLRRVFAAANERRLGIVIHLWTGREYGRADAEALLANVLPAASDIPVQIAHLAGAGPGYGPDDAVAVYADAAERKDPRVRNLWFDVASVVTHKQTPEQLALIARRLRQIGIDRVLFASDSARGFNPAAGPAWETFRRLPLTSEEMRQVAKNTAPYLPSLPIDVAR